MFGNDWFPRNTCGETLNRAVLEPLNNSQRTKIGEKNEFEWDKINFFDGLH